MRSVPRSLLSRLRCAAAARACPTAAGARHRVAFSATPLEALEVRERQRGTLGVGAAPPFAPSGTEEVPIDVTAMEVFAAAHRIRQGEDGIKRTSMYHSRRLSKMLDMDIYLKHEFTHPTGSFKERGGCVRAGGRAGGARARTLPAAPVR